MKAQKSNKSEQIVLLVKKNQTNPLFFNSSQPLVPLVLLLTTCSTEKWWLHASKSPQTTCKILWWIIDAWCCFVVGGKGTLVKTDGITWLPLLKYNWIFQQDNDQNALPNVGTQNQCFATPISGSGMSGFEPSWNRLLGINEKRPLEQTKKYQLY